MKLNLDCVRDILLTLEEITDGVIQYDISESNYKSTHQNILIKNMPTI